MITFLNTRERHHQFIPIWTIGETKYWFNEIGDTTYHDNNGLHNFKKKRMKNDLYYVAKVVRLGIFMFKVGVLVLSTLVDITPMSFPGIDLNIIHVNIIPPIEPFDHLE